MIIFSDLHLDVDSADVCLGQVLPGIFDAARDSHDKDIAFLGDWWHLRYRVVVRLQVAVRDELRRWGDAGMKLRIIPGNHDQVDVAGRNALEVFQDLPHVQVCTVPLMDSAGLWLPYRKNWEQFSQSIDSWRHVRGGKPGVIFAHQGIMGAWQNDACRDTTGVPQGAFGGSDTVLLGHYHKRQKVDGRPFWYVGSPRQVTAAEAGQDKGYAVWDGKDLRWVNKAWGPRYYRFELEEGASLDLSEVRPGDDVRVSVLNENDGRRISQELDGLEVRHTVTPVVSSGDSRLEVNGTGLSAFAKAYVSAQAGDLDSAALLNLYDHFQADGGA